MKKALALALTAFLVLAMATAAFAVEVSYEGKVAVKWSNEAIELDDLEAGLDEDGEQIKKNSDGFAKDALEAKVKIDFTKDYGDGVTAGVVTIVEAHADVYDEDKPEGENVNKEFKFDGAGWVQVERDLFTVKAATEIDDGVGKDFGEFNIAGAPGLGLTLNLVDGLTINSILNGGSDYSYLVKGEFAQDLFTIGGGYQNSYNADEDVTQTAIGVYGIANPIDGLVINAEYGSRNYDIDAEGDDEEKGTAILIGAAYDWNALSAKAGFFMTDAFGATVDKDDLDDEDWRINEAFKSTESALHEYFGTDKASVIYADLSYQLTDALSVNGYFDYLLSAKNEDDKDIKDDFEAVSYKVGVSYGLGDLTLDGWYKAYVDSQVGAKASYALVEGVDASFEVGYNMFDDKDTDDKVTYTAKIEAAF